MKWNSIPRRALLSSLSLGVIVVLVCALGVLQYHWIGEISEAEQKKLQDNLRVTVTEISRDFDSELNGATEKLFPTDAEVKDLGLQQAYEARNTQWRASTNHPNLFSRVGYAWEQQGQLHLYLVSGISTSSPTQSSPKTLSASKTSNAEEWPAEWSGMKQNILARLHREFGGAPPPNGRGQNEFNARGPSGSKGSGFAGTNGAGTGGLRSSMGDTTLIEVPRFRAFPQGGPPDAFGPVSEQEWLLLEVDRGYVAGTILPDLLARHLGANYQSNYDVAVFPRTNPALVIYPPGFVNTRSIEKADATVTLFDVVPRMLRGGRGMTARNGGPRNGGDGRMGAGERPGENFERSREIRGVAENEQKGNNPRRFGRRPRPFPDSARTKSGAVDGNSVPGSPAPESPGGKSRDPQTLAPREAAVDLGKGPGMGPGAGQGFLPFGAGRGRWQLAVYLKSGSLEAVVQQARTRNLALSAAILLLLLATSIALVRFTRQTQRLAEVEMEFVAGVSHELRTPLTVIRTAAFNLQGKLAGNPAQVERYGTLIQQESEKLTAIVEQVLQFASAKSGRLIRERQPMSVDGVIEASLQSSRGILEETMCRVEKHIEPGLPVVLGDAIALRHALQNLIANAVKYGMPGSGSRQDSNWIGIFARALAVTQGNVVELRVVDRGPGIPAEERQHIFDAFYRGERAVRDQIHGTGLGLSLVRKIVEAHGGTVDVESEPGSGSSFIVRIPAQPGEHSDEFAHSLG